MRPPGTRLLLAAALAAAAMALGPAQAAGRASVNGRSVTVATDGGRVVVQPNPFRLRFLDSSGRVVLSEVANPRSGPIPLPETTDPEGLGLERQPDRTVYAPLNFEVGTQVADQWNSGFWTGNMLFWKRQGTVHSAQRVLRARRAGPGARLLVATSDPGRRLVVTIEPDGPTAIRVRARPQRADGVITMGDSFAAAPREGFHGFGGRHGSTDKNGEKLNGWGDQENLGGQPTLQIGLGLLDLLVESGSDYTTAELGGAPALPGGIPGGFERYLVPNGPNGAYYPQAQFVSNRGYGFLLNRSEFSWWRMANDRPDAWQVQAASSRLDYTVTLGPGPRRAMGELTRITGRHRLPPRWAQEPILWRAVQVPALPGQPAAEDPQSYRAKIEQDLADMTRYGVRPAAYAFEGWALLRDPGYVRGLIRRLHRMGVRAVVYHRAYVADDALSTQPSGDYQETLAKGLVATDANGKPYVFGANGGGPSTLLDFTDPKTVRWWKRRLLLTLKLGADGFMQDFGEQVQLDMRFHDGSTGATMHNRYPVIWHRISRRILDAYSRRHPGRGPIWFFTRSGYSGRPGSAAFEMGNFPGDETVDWSAGSGLRSLAPDMLNRAVGGAFGFSTDIGGYADFLTGPPSEELFNRWSEWSALTPYFRVHNSASGGTRMPWSYGQDSLDRWKAMARLHERALPLIRGLWRRGRATGVPPTRPMWLAAPEAPAFGRDQQWLLGADVLVAPVVEQGAASRQVALPAGCWRYVPTGERFRGPGSAIVPAPLGTLPHFFRCGSRPFARR